MWGWICKERVQNCVEGRMSNTLEDLCKYSFMQLLKGASQNMQKIFRLFKDDFSFSFVRLFKNAWRNYWEKHMILEGMLPQQHCNFSVISADNFQIPPYWETPHLTQVLPYPSGIWPSGGEITNRQPHKTLLKIMVKPCIGEQASWTQVELFSLKSTDCNL